MQRKRFVNLLPKTIPAALLAAGVFLIILSFTIDLLRMGSMTPTFGWKQWLVLLSGLGLVAAGSWAVPPATMQRVGAGILKKRILLPLAAILLGVYWLGLAAANGLELSPDSTYYLTYALKIHTGYDLSISPLWPPLYPLLLSLFMGVTQFPAESAALVSGLSMILLLLLFVLILREFNPDAVLTALFLLLLFTYTKMLFIFQYAWSEVPFAVFSLAAFAFVVRHMNTQRLSHYILASIFVSLTVLTRYAGFALIFTFGVYTAYFLYPESKRKFEFIWKYLLAFSLSFVPILLYLVNNYLTSGTVFGPRTEASLTFYQNFNRTMNVLIPDIGLPLGILLIAAITLFGLRCSQNRRAGDARVLLPLAFLLVFLLSYLFLVIYSTTAVVIDGITTRYFSPVYPLIFVFIALTFASEIRQHGFDERVGKVYAHLLNLFVYGFLLAALFFNLREFTNFVTLLSVKPNNTAVHLSSGFNRTATRQSLHTYFRETLAQHDRIYVTAMYDYSDKAPRPHLGRALLFRGNVFTGDFARQISFQEIKDALGEDNTDFTLSFEQNGKAKSVVYRNLPYVNSNEHLFEHLRKIMNAENLESLYFITAHGEAAQIGRGLEDFLPEDLVLISQTSIAPYQIYHLKRNAPLTGH